MDYQTIRVNDQDGCAVITMMRPDAVDVSGGVESEPGIKDAGKIRRFIESVRVADSTL